MTPKCVKSGIKPRRHRKHTCITTRRLRWAGLGLSPPLPHLGLSRSTEDDTSLAAAKAAFYPRTHVRGFFGAWRSLVARLFWEQKATSSNLVAPTNWFFYGGLSWSMHV